VCDPRRRGAVAEIRRSCLNLFSLLVIPSLQKRFPTIFGYFKAQ
jgi:hypothetical protein